MEEGFDTPIDHFQFRQMPAEFKLKSCPSSVEKPAWSSSLPPRASLLQISHQKGLLFYPHYERGAVGFVPVANLAEKDYLPADTLGFPGDETAITALFCTSNFLLVGKESKKLYTVDLALDNPVKKPFVCKIAQNESAVAQITFWNDTVIAVLADGSVKGFSLPDLQVKDDLLSELDAKNISCVSVFEDSAAFGYKDSNEIVILQQSNTIHLTVPAENGEKGINSLYFASASTLLCSLVAADENDYVDLIVIEKPLEDSCRFTKFLDPCASRPPAPNQFYFCGLNDWSRQDLSELVLIGNFASPDIGVAARLSPEEPFGTFFIDVDEGLAQLPLLKGSELTFPVGLALDFTSSFHHENRQDSDAEPFAAAPVLWILTSAGDLCPFALLKTNERGPWPFMKDAPQLQLSPPRVLEAPVSDADDSPPPSPAVFRTQSTGVAQSDLTLSSEEEDEVSDEVTTEVPSTPSKAEIEPPLTPSKMPLSAIASLQKSSSESSPVKPIEPVKPVESIKPVEPSKPVESVKPAEMFKPIEPAKPIETVKPAASFAFNLKTKSETSLPPSSPMSIVSQEPTIPVPIKKEEKMESVTCSPYQSILLTEVAEAHESMQNDLHALRQLVYKNSILLRQNTINYFSTIEALEKYAGKVESLLGSGERVFLSLKDKSIALKASFEGVAAEAKRLQSFCDGIKNDAKIDWQRKASQLEQLSEEVATKIGQLQDILAQPAAKRASSATITCLHQSIQERLQLLMIYLSTLFVSSAAEVDDSTRGTLERMRSLCLSSESLVDEMSTLFIASTEVPSKKKRHERLLELSKARGARLLIPTEFKKPIEPVKAAAVAKVSVDDKLIEEFISAVKLNDSVPEFRDNAAAANVEKSGKPAAVGAINTADKSTEGFHFGLFKDTPSTKAAESPSASKPFTFGPVTEAAPENLFTKPKTFSGFTLPESETVSTVVPEAPKAPFSFVKPATEKHSVNLSDTKSEAKNSASESEVTNAKSDDVIKKSSSNTETKPFSFSFAAPTAEPLKSKTEPLVEKKTESFAEVKTEPVFKATSPSSDSSFLSVSSKPESSSDAFSFKFDFTPSAPKEPVVKTSTASNDEIAKKPIPGILSVSSADPEKAPIPALLTAQNAFAPPSLTSPEKPAFSLTSTPTFGSTTSFGSTASPSGFGFSSPAASLATTTTSSSTQPAFGQPAFGQTSSAGPAFGQTSMPMATSFMPAVSSAPPKPGAFAAFAQSGAQSLGFSSFTAPAGASTASNGLSFASFATPNSNGQSSTEQEKDKSKPSFSFSGFR